MQLSTTLQQVIPDGWMLHCILCNAVDYKDTVESDRYIITIVKSILLFELDPDGLGTTEPQQCPGYEQYLTTSVIEGDVPQ